MEAEQRALKLQHLCETDQRWKVVAATQSQDKKVEWPNRGRCLCQQPLIASKAHLELAS